MYEKKFMKGASRETCDNGMRAFYLLNICTTLVNKLFGFRFIKETNTILKHKYLFYPQNIQLLSANKYFSYLDGLK